MISEMLELEEGRLQGGEKADVECKGSHTTCGKILSLSIFPSPQF